MTLHALALELSAVLALWLTLGAWQQDRDQPGRVCFGAMCVAALVWCTGELLLVRGAIDHATGERVRYLGIMTLPALWLGVAAHAGQLRVAQRLPWFPVALMVPELLIYSTLFMGPWSALFLAPESDTVGPLWWVHSAYAYALVFAGTTICFVTALRPRLPWRRRRLAAGLASLAPLICNFAYIQKDLRFEHDPTPLLLGVSLLLLRQALLPGGMLDVLPIAQRDLIEHLPFGVVLSDPAGVVIDLNGAARRGLALSRLEALGRTLDAVLGHAPQGTRVEISPVALRGGTQARLAVLDFPVASQETPTEHAA
ncbi:MAG TPA: histidine kinase N-terminal 7TM domain-containing protein, partial [Myxococcota bacterium]|nr:histidine kinase N-terminal 7TM domain-containing protein [Myxococcota bacterium]